MAVTTDRRRLLGGALAAGVLLPAATRAQSNAGPNAIAAPEELALWPGDAPGMPDEAPVETVMSRDSGPPRRRVKGVVRPRMLVFRPQMANGASVLVIPGGGYAVLSIDNGGFAPAQALTQLGYTVFVLIYRLPGEGWANRETVPLADAQRALRLIRSRYPGLDPQRVGTMGFSAGGHLCALTGAMFDREVYAPVDAADALSARPACAAPIYPVINLDTPFTHEGSRNTLLGPNASTALREAWSPDRNVPENAPPFFLLHAEDDTVTSPEDSLMMRAALKAQNVPVETYLLTSGGHGFGGMPAAGSPAGGWIDIWHKWAQRSGL